MKKSIKSITAESSNGKVSFRLKELEDQHFIDDSSETSETALLAVSDSIEAIEIEIEFDRQDLIDFLSKASLFLMRR